MKKKVSSESVVKDIRRRTRTKYSSEEKYALYWKVFVVKRAQPTCVAVKACLVIYLYYRWSKDFLEAGKKRLIGDTTREASSHEVGDLKKENEHLKQLVAEIALKNRVLKKSLNGTDFEDIDI